MHYPSTRDSFSNVCYSFYLPLEASYRPPSPPPLERVIVAWLQRRVVDSCIFGKKNRK